MPAVARVGIDKTGVTPEALITGGGQSKVYCNGYLVAVFGDSVATHTVGKSTHIATLNSSSSKVYINGKGVCRVGDTATCGHYIISGSPNTYSG